jgi:Ca2+-binding RTX toxin-like protein
VFILFVTKFREVSSPLAGLNSLVVYGQAANQPMKVADNVTLPTFLFGGDGSNVHIEGGGGPTVEVSGSGKNSHLEGGNGRNILIAGQGGGHLKGNGAQISGATPRSPRCARNRRTENR